MAVDMSKAVLRKRRYWIGVVSESHAQYAVEIGIGQTCNGKGVKLKQMRRGDWLIYYSPRTEMKEGEISQSFTAIGEVVDDSVYPYKMSENFIPYRRNIRYVPCKKVSIRSLLDKLQFTRNQRNWGNAFRFGQFEITEDDFLLLAYEMLGDYADDFVDH